jgi:nitrite reductase (NADH) small subunit
MNAMTPLHEQAAAWTEICALADIPILGSRVVRRIGAPDIAIFRNTEDKVFALLDRCPHKGGPLSQGIVFGERVACPLHNWTIELASGCAVTPDEGCTRKFAVRVDDGRIYLETGALGEPALASPTAAPTPASALDFVSSGSSATLPEIRP